MVVRKARVVPFECVVRGYLAGSGWKEYRASGTVCGITLPARLGRERSDRADLHARPPRPRPATTRTSRSKRWPSAVGTEVAETLQSMSLEVYRIAAEHALECGLILADTKFEWGFDDETGELLLVDEVLTPDSSRYWPLETYSPGRSAAVVRQAVRPRLARDHRLGQVEPAARVCRRRSSRRPAHKYVEAFERLTGQAFPWR